MSDELIRKSKELIVELEYALIEQKAINKTMIRAFDSDDLLDMKKVANENSSKNSHRNRKIIK